MTQPIPKLNPDDLARVVAAMDVGKLAFALEGLSIIFSQNHRHYWLLRDAARRLRHAKSRRG